MSGLEVSFGYYLEGSGIGRLKDKERNEVRDLKSIIENDLWEGEGNYHIVYVRNLSEVVPKKDTFSAEEVAAAIVAKRYKAEHGGAENQYLLKSWIFFVFRTWRW